MRIVILGGGFGGLNAALLLGKALQSTLHEIVLLSDTPYFLFRPSLIWVPFNNRKIKEISFPLNEILQKVGVQFMQKKSHRFYQKKNRYFVRMGPGLYTIS